MSALHPFLRSSRSRFVGAVALLIVGVVASWLATARHGYDYMHLYLTTHGIATGSPIYDSAWRASFVPRACGKLPPGEGVFYPPGTGFAMLPLAALSCGNFAHALHVLLILAIVVGVRALIKLFNPEARPETWIWVSGLVLLSACVRWGMTHLQSAPLIFAALALEIACLHRGRPVLAAVVATFAAALKVTMGPPFIALLLLHRRFRAVGGVIAAIGLINLLGFWRMGGATAFAGYRAAIAVLETPGTINTPNPWDPQAGIRLDWVALFTGLTGDPRLSRALALLLALGVGSWALWMAWRLPLPLTPAATSVAMLPLVFVNLMVTYHHAYDITVAWAPLLAAMLLVGRAGLPQPRLAIWLVTPLLLIMAFMPIALTQRVFYALAGNLGLGLMRLAFPIATTLALAAGMTQLLGRLQRERGRLAPAESVQRST
jgi:Glycosyltransferase family 87